MAPEIEKQLDIRLIVDHSLFRRCYVKADAQEAEQLLFHLPVSYTHLDVYKRQGLQSGSALP